MLQQVDNASGLNVDVKAAAMKDILVVKRHNAKLRKSASRWSKYVGVIKAGDQLKILHGDHESDKWLKVSRVLDPTTVGFFKTRDTRSLAEGEVVFGIPPQSPVSLLSFANMVVKDCLEFGGNPGVLIALAHVETGKHWVKKEGSWARGELMDYQHEEHLGVGPFQFRPKIWKDMLGYFPDEYFDMSDRTHATGQVRFATLLEKKYFESIGKIKYAAIDIYPVFLFGIDGAKLFAAADPSESMPVLLEKIFGSKQAASNETKWRQELMLVDDKPVDVALFKQKMIRRINAGLAEAKILLKEIGVVDGANSVPDTPVGAEEQSGRSGARTLPSIGNPEVSGYKSDPANTGDYVLFRYRPGYKAPQGILVAILQAALKSDGHYSGAVDGVYGEGTQNAVAEFQKMSEDDESATGALKETEWEKLTGEPIPSVFDRCLQLTSAFEGHGFKLATGNWDNTGLTWGITGYTLIDDLPEFIARVDKDYPKEKFVAKAFKQREKKLRDILTDNSGTDASKIRSRIRRRAWGDNISVGSKKYHLEKGWREAFARFGDFSEVQYLQIKDVRERWWGKIVIRDAKLYGASDVRDLAMWFDTAVQNGGAGRESISGPLDKLNDTLTGQARREKWANTIADGSGKPANNAELNEKIREDVRSRRMTIAGGQGTVHGADYMLEDWGLDPRPIDITKLEEVHAAVMPETLVEEARIPAGQRHFTGTTDVTHMSDRSLTALIGRHDLPHDMQDNINRGLHSSSNTLMLNILGRPKRIIGRDGSNANLYPSFEKHIVTASVGPFRVTGLKPAVALLKNVMDEIKVEEPEVYHSLSSAGMLWVRLVRNSSSSISNHSWGTAIDLKINGKLDAYRDGKVMYGLTRVYHIFNKHGFFWGIYFNSEDAMHFEVSREKLLEWHNAGVFSSDPKPIAPISTMLTIGSRGLDVINLHRDLKRILDDDDLEGSTFNSKTALAVQAFQMKHSELVVDGIAGGQTLAKIKAVLGAL